MVGGGNSVLKKLLVQDYTSAHNRIIDSG